MHHIFVKNDFVYIDQKTIKIDKNSDIENYNHLVNALRVKIGESVLCSVYPFSSTYDYKTIIKDIDSEKIELMIEESVEGSELNYTINLYQGMCKSDKFEFVIEKAVELGVSSITPLMVDNCVVRFDSSDKRYKGKFDRYNKIAKSAAEQSKRHVIPEVHTEVTIDEMIKKGKDSYNIVFYENACGIEKTHNLINEIKSQSAGSKPINIFVGPEGGFTEKEIDLMKENGFYVLSLGKRILRTETAAITALSILMYEFEV